MKTCIYVDGFNLYYGCLKGTSYKWLDLLKMCQLLLPNDEILKIKYFTALVSPRANDPDKPLRQQTLLRALRTIPNLEIILGSFLSYEKKMPLAPAGSGYVRVIKTEEKGSDVNLATHLLLDGFHNVYELAVVVSNDSDLVLPIRVVSEQFDKRVGLLNPQVHTSMALLPHVMFVKNIRKHVLNMNQFPDTLTDLDGAFHKPSGW